MNNQSVSTGGQAPDFTLPMVNGSTFHLGDYKGKSNVLLFFNEGLDCTPCLNQIVDLDKDYNEFKSRNILVVAISTDPQSSLAQWATLNKISNVLVLSDQNLSVDTTYETLGSNVSMMPGTRAGHTFVLVDTSGVIKWREDYGPGIMYVEDNEIISNIMKALA